jgi:hypothetical protein
LRKDQIGHLVSLNSGITATWLRAWTGNRPEKLAGYYSDDCFYLDPGIPNGAKGRAELIGYFRKLLAQNPEWVWSQIEAIPMEGGFLNKWMAKIPVGEKTLECIFGKSVGIGCGNERLLCMSRTQR